jgi:hypothetical protein
MGALSVSGPKYRIEAMGLKHILPVLFENARDLTRILGGSSDALPPGRAKAPTRRKSKPTLTRRPGVGIAAAPSSKNG